MKLDQRWPRVFTCPTDETGLKQDDLGAGVYNPVFSNRGKLLNDGCEGCAGCDMREECPGPIEYAPVDTSRV
jgi:hypothetical protein